MQRLVDLEMPIVAAVNGPVSVHSEYALLADIVVAADTTAFSDFPTSPSASCPATASTSCGKKSWVLTEPAI
jgi:hypothetical protein